MTQYHFLSQQEQGLASRDQIVSDYHPITRQEIAGLLAVAADCRQRHDLETVSSIHVRLCQGIRGFASPRLYDGPVAGVMAEVDRAYVEYGHLGADEGLINYLDTLIHSLG